MRVRQKKRSLLDDSKEKMFVTVKSVAVSNQTELITAVLVRDAFTEWTIIAHGNYVTDYRLYMYI